MTAGRHPRARWVPSPNCDARPSGMAVELVVIHNISLPPNQFGGPAVEQLFTNQLDPTSHQYYAGLAGLRVSAHFFIRRNGELVQFVDCNARAWHAGVSRWQGRERCNDFSIGIELEGTDAQAFTAKQYQRLIGTMRWAAKHYPIQAATGHRDIAPGRKTDPGPFFDWQVIRAAFPAWQIPAN